MTSQQRLYLVGFSWTTGPCSPASKGQVFFNNSHCPVCPKATESRLTSRFGKVNTHILFQPAVTQGPRFLSGAPRNAPHFLWLRHRSYILWETRVGGMYFERASWLTNWRSSYCYWIQRTPSGQNAELLLSLEWGRQIWPFQGTTSENMTEFLGCPT